MVLNGGGLTIPLRESERVYPVTTLADARRKAEVSRKQVSNGIDPSNVRKITKAVKQLQVDNEVRIAEGLPLLNSFSDVAGKWLASTVHLINAITQLKKISRLERLAFPLLGSCQSIKLNHLMFWQH